MTLEGSFYNDMSGDYNDASASPLATGNVGSPQSPPQATQYLSNEEFESLNKAVQLLRISQLRYIVQKFSIPASGNKTKLLNLVLSIFQSLRYDKVLIDILQEINNLLAQQRDAFTNPLASIGHLEITQIDPSFMAPPNPMNLQSEPPFILGPIAAPPGQSSGQFSFINSSSNNQVNVSFLFPGGNPQQFAFQADLNGYPFEISAEDPYPQPIDISHILNMSAMPNTLNIKMVNCPGPMMICIREYKFRGLQDVANQICKRNVDLYDENPLVLSSTCQHSVPFSLLAFLSRAFGTGNWNCPICGQLIDLSQIKIVGNASSEAPMPLASINMPPPLQMTPQFPTIATSTAASGSGGGNSSFGLPNITTGNPGDIFQQQTSDIFGSFDWDNF